MKFSFEPQLEQAFAEADAERARKAAAEEAQRARAQERREREETMRILGISPQPRAQPESTPIPELRESVQASAQFVARALRREGIDTDMTLGRRRPFMPAPVGWGLGEVKYELPMGREGLYSSRTKLIMLDKQGHVRDQERKFAKFHYEKFYAGINLGLARLVAKHELEI